MNVFFNLRFELKNLFANDYFLDLPGSFQIKYLFFCNFILQFTFVKLIKIFLVVTFYSVLLK